MRARHLLGLCVAAVLPMQTHSLSAQGRSGAQVPGMPDMSNAPADIQAIMKKVMSGGIPTQDEAKRLGAYMAANKGAIAKSATAYGDSMKGQAAAAKGRISAAADQNACPARVALSPNLALAPTNAVASVLLDSIRRAYAAKLTPKALAMLQSALAKVNPADALNQIAGALLLKGYLDLAMLTYVAEAQRAPSAWEQGAWGDLGTGLIGAGEPLAAIPVLRHALALGARTGALVANLGVAYADLGDLKTATTLLQEAIRVAPSSGQAYDALARVASCDGNMVLAAHAMQKAQDEDWDESRQKTIDQHDKNDAAKNSQSSDDDAAEAAKPLPAPPGPPLFPPASGGGRPSNFSAIAPKIPDDYRESAAAARYNASMISSYADLMRQVASQSLGKPSGTSGRRSSTAGLVVVYSISNASQAIAGASVVQRRTAAKLAMMRTPFREKHVQIATEEARRASPIEAAYFKCDKMKHDCFVKYCRDMKPVVTEAYAAMAGNAKTFIGGIDGLAQKFTAAENEWFFWAGEPAARKIIDNERRYFLAEFQSEAFSAASMAATDMPKGCEDALAQKKAGTGTLDAAQDPGECKSRSIHLPYFATMDADCHEMKMSIDFPPIVELCDGATPNLDIKRATSDKYGKFFVGVSRDDEHGTAGYDAGAQVTWDSQGWVKGAGPALRGEADLAPFVHVSGDVMANGLSKGPVMQGSATLNVDAPLLKFSPSVSFGGKY